MQQQSISKATFAEVLELISLGQLVKAEKMCKEAEQVLRITIELAPTFAYDLTDIGEYYLQYQRMMDYWHEVLPDRVLTVQYEEVVTDFENQVRRMLEYCELPFEESCLNYYDTDRPVRTASSEQVRQPIYTQSLHRWRLYEQHLDELKEVLEPVLPRYRKYEKFTEDNLSDFKGP